MKNWLVLATAYLALATVASGCGGDDDGENEQAAAPATEEPAAGGGETLQLAADASGAFRFNKKTLEAGAGDVTLVMDNPSPIAHNVSVRGDGIDEEGKTVGTGEKSEVTASVKPGDYTFYCSVPGHEEGGMLGTLTVK